jgi:uncharacterized protein (DUF433 family)
MARELADRIVVNPHVMVGKPVVRGTRIPVELVLQKLAINPDIDELLLDYPRLTRDDIRACLEYAYAVVHGEDVFPTLVSAP